MKIRAKLKDIIMLPESDYEKSFIVKSCDIDKYDPETIIVLNCNVVRGLTIYKGMKMEDFEKYDSI